MRGEVEPLVCVLPGQLLVPTGSWMLILWLDVVFPGRLGELACRFSCLDLPFFQNKYRGQRREINWFCCDSHLSFSIPSSETFELPP